jgi:hypothetical protein
MSLTRNHPAMKYAREVVYWRRGLTDGVCRGLEETSKKFGLSYSQITRMEQQVLGWPDGPPDPARVKAFHQKVALLRELRKGACYA